MSEVYVLMILISAFVKGVEHAIIQQSVFSMMMLIK